MNLSQRMEAIAEFVTPASVLADVGCDHAHLPIALVQRGRIRRAIAMDVRNGPLDHARENILMCGLGDRIETRLADGVSTLVQGEVSSVVIAGMGGDLMLHILRGGVGICRDVDELILQPQSRIELVRRFLREEGFRIAGENMVLEDGKFYPMMRVVYGGRSSGGDQMINREAEWKKDFAHNPAQLRRGKHMCGQEYAFRERLSTDMKDRYGPLLLEARHPVLYQYLKKQHRDLFVVWNHIKGRPVSRKLTERFGELLYDIMLCEQAMSLYVREEGL